MTEQPPKKRWPFVQAGMPVPKNAVTIGIIVGGILGSTLALITLRIIRPAAEEVDSAEWMPVRAMPPRPAPATATASPTKTVASPRDS